MSSSSPSKSTPSSTPSQTPTATPNYWTTSTGILAIILCIVLLVIGFFLFRMITPKKTSNSNSYDNDKFSTDNPMSKGGYFYFD